MRNRLTIAQVLGFITTLFLAPSVLAKEGWQLNMFQGVTPISHDIYRLHMIAIWVCAGIGIVVFGVMIFALIFHRKSRGHKAAEFHENIKLEIFWTLVPFLILVALAIPATQVLIRMDNTDHSDVTIKVVGYQWKWQYEYVNEGVGFYSMLATPYAAIHNQQPKSQWYLLEVDHPLVVPIHKKIRFLVTSNDVIHSWWVPELGVKRDAIPGFMHEAWAKIDTPGVYRGQCAELCGIYHGFMPIVVKAVPEEEYAQWLKDQKAQQQAMLKRESEPQADMSREDLMALGKHKYEQVCAACHMPTGEGIPPMYPALKGSSVSVGHPISRHIDIILKGVPGSAMQAYAGQLTNEEVAAIATYERNAWGNNTNDLVQPNDVRIVRFGEETKPTIVKKAKSGGLQ
ncbi:MAG: cytochrome c oxidase subunit II [Gammaproteobacteria bacterium]|nr:cytochrome c oxidase subunit II [Gammaproteobacteria bacterium]